MEILPLHVSKEEARHMLSGHKIALSNKHIGGQHHAYISRAKHAKLRHSLGSGKRVHHVKLSKKEIEHTLRHGTGFFDTLKNLGKKAIKIAAPILAPIAKQYAGKAQQYLASKGPLGAVASQFLGDASDAAINKAVDASQGLGLRKHRKMKGGSFQAGFRGEGKGKRKPSEYNVFVGKYTRAHKHEGSPQQVLSAAAVAWKSHKHGGGVRRGKHGGNVLDAIGDLFS